MHAYLRVGLSAYDDRERSDNLEPKASFRFLSKREDVVVSNTINGGGSGEQLILGTRTSGRQEKVFHIADFSHLLLPTVNENCIHDMLTQIPIPLATIESGIKQQISTYALDAALLCQERRARFLEIVIYFTFQYVGSYEEHRMSSGLDVESMLMGTVNDGDSRGFRRVPASRFEIQVMKNKKFDDEDQQQFSTCMICMDEFVKGVLIVKLPCTHFFHWQCFFKWSKNKNSCPICRFALPPPPNWD
ncbi:hypothetical protein NE237_031717 [Protea cynaroides]|uniref:RING-type domain-containing protein n=1 Tax=Protea cynaroides TaxID=273540 RepID=A0A9Q0R2U9_9MAGN|nr:hypothetical protein NE237_031717 [Protea cynaroides]